MKIQGLIYHSKNYCNCKIWMIKAELTSFSEYINKTVSTIVHKSIWTIAKQRKTHGITQDDSYFPQKELLDKKEIVKSLTKIQTAEMDNIRTSQIMLNLSIECLVVSEIQSIATLITHHEQQQQYKQQQQGQLQQQH